MGGNHGKNVHDRIFWSNLEGIFKQGFFISNFIHKIMVNVVGHANNEELILKTLGRMVWVHAIFQPTLYNIGGPRK